MTHDHPVTRRAVLAVGTAAFGAAMIQTATAADEKLPWIDAREWLLAKTTEAVFFSA